MIDWLRDDHRDPSVEVAGQPLPIIIRRHARSKRLTMRMAPDGGELRITMPTWGRTRDALEFANARLGWIEQQLAKVPQQIELGDGTVLPFSGRDLTIRWQDGGPRKVRREDDVLLVGGPRDRLATRVQRWFESQALHIMRQDLTFYCERAGLAVPELRLSRAQRRWGSCTGERDSGRCIRINWRLVMAPDHVRRSVVAHEVTHLVHFDHSPAFYYLLERVFEDEISAADVWLKDKGRTLYAVFG
ncbi:M48 family metallopeptidase [Aurantiacibacter marinus]|uniref:Metal-dependent hydrolase n=1 Tax=Aurantiacibacter marinus TaxID=874156 RepID=A0A0H0XSP4_9SPHN|nr:SprT family zinc-dependent metalloprotease [Aurantiacibacter marinus]KLI65026.1 metal-dependent hydrolase [Aurantiacibacter marinus]